MDAQDLEELRRLLKSMSSHLDDLTCEAAILATDVQRMTLLTHQVIRAVDAHLDKKGRIKPLA